MNAAYPTQFDSIPPWAAEQDVSVRDARVRFAQYVILRDIATSSILSARLVFKGGNALDFHWVPNRSTQDLDFSADMTLLAPPLDETTLRDHLTRAFAGDGSGHRTRLAVHRVQRQPPGPNKTFATYKAGVGYALQDEDRLQRRKEHNEPSTNVIPVDISLNEPICATCFFPVDPTHQPRVSSIEDIVAEKLRALLQQPIRRRTRPQDLLDIVAVLRAYPDLDLRQVAAFLLRKAAAWDVPVSRAAFNHPDVLSRTQTDYDALEETARKMFCPLHYGMG